MVLVLAFVSLLEFCKIQQLDLVLVLVGNFRFLAIGLGIGIGKIALIENWHWNYYWKNHFQYY